MQKKFEFFLSTIASCANAISASTVQEPSSQTPERLVIGQIGSRPCWLTIRLRPLAKPEFNSDVVLGIRPRCRLRGRRLGLSTPSCLAAQGEMSPARPSGSRFAIRVPGLSDPESVRNPRPRSQRPRVSEAIRASESLSCGSPRYRCIATDSSSTRQRPQTTWPPDALTSRERTRLHPKHRANISARDIASESLSRGGPRHRCI